MAEQSGSTGIRPGGDKVDASPRNDGLESHAAEVERSRPLTLGFAVSALGLSDCEAHMLTEVGSRGQARVSAKGSGEWTRAEMHSAADSLADAELVIRTSDEDVRLTATFDDAVVSMASAVLEKGEKAQEKEREGLYGAIIGRMSTPARVIGSTGDIEAEFIDMLRPHRVIINGFPHYTASVADFETRDTRSIQRTIEAADWTSETNVVTASRFLIDSEARFFGELNTQKNCTVRVTDYVPLRLALLDGVAAVIPVDPNAYMEGAMLVTDEDAVAQVGLQLAGHLARSRAFVQLDRPDLSSREARVLELLSQGHTDDAIARRVGVSDRSIRRVIRALQEKFGVDSRISLAIESARRDGRTQHE